MPLERFGFIVTGAGLDPDKHRASIRSDAFDGIMVGVSRPEQGVAVARALVADGIQLIELCGGFGPVWTAKVIEAIDGAVPVGSVGYGPESINGMHALFPD
ncbi:hypothetical protein EV385_6460 [Krasilnikovia cinnamomea]|uniref:Uncharacterized protein n=1 Tax=Krasilnikovia cinnamomea TaxID=349313 RepID=A0A4Q7ZV73_9ACTN|nr:DUF6506 family protein [Krasilnikovia cinnamomea]RZU54509.1 hypothetical protein EV385_6460 [Krasilnikovia cinnamomea]